jgi:hypothetical protein
MSFKPKSVIFRSAHFTAAVCLSFGWLFSLAPSPAALSSPTLGEVASSRTESNSVHACPFCAAINATFAEQIDKHEVVVIANLIEAPAELTEDAQEYPKGKFKIARVIKGNEFVQPGMTFQTQLVGSYPLDEQFLVMGVEPPNVFWSTPMKTTERIVKYLLEARQLPAKGPERLVFFQEYFEDEESILAFDAYDEFAVADYRDLIAMKEQIKRDKILGWINNPETRVDRRRLYFTMLGVCGTQEDVAMLESFINSNDSEKLAGLDSLVACYLTLKGEAGVGLIEEKFLKNPEVDFVDTNAVISALRFHGTEVSIIPRSRITAAVRLLLDRPNMADMIIPDLARWEDWSVMERLVKMFKETDQDSEWIRVPVITYLRACPRPEAKEYIKELAKIDPDAVRRADFFMGGFIDDDNDDEEETTREQGDQDKGDQDKRSEDKVQENKTGLQPSGSGDQKIDPEQAGNNLEESNPSRNSRPETYFLPCLLEKSLGNELVDSVSFLEGAAEFELGSGPASEQDWQPTPQGKPSESQGSMNPAPAETYQVRKVPLEESSETAEFLGNPAASAEKTETLAPSPNPSAQPGVIKEDGSALAAVSGPAGLNPANPPLAMAYPPVPSWMILMIVGTSAAFLFILLWSVVNGWFERLIF